MLRELDINEMNEVSGGLAQGWSIVTPFGIYNGSSSDYHEDYQPNYAGDGGALSEGGGGGGGVSAAFMDMVTAWLEDDLSEELGALGASAGLIYPPAGVVLAYAGVEIGQHATGQDWVDAIGNAYSSGAAGGINGGSNFP